MVDYTHAGRYDEIFMDDRQRLMRQKPITVFVKDTDTPAALYTDRTRVTPGPNPFLTDIRGNGTFYASPGEYDLSYDGFERRVTVPTDFEDLAVGSPGAPGAGAFPYLFQTSTTDSDPGPGGMRFNHATPGSVTRIFVDDVTQQGVNVSAMLATFDDSTGPIKGYLEIVNSAQDEYHAFTLTAIEDGGTYWKFTVAWITGSGGFDPAELVYLRFNQTGNQGAVGPNGPANTLTVGTVETLGPGEDVEVEITGSAPSQTINFAIPEGDPGFQGVYGPVGTVPGPYPDGTVSFEY